MLLRIARSAFSAAPCIVKPLRDYMWKKRIIPLITEFSDGSLLSKSGILKAISKAVGRLKGMVVGKGSILPRLLPSIASCMLSTWGVVQAKGTRTHFLSPLTIIRHFAQDSTNLIQARDCHGSTQRKRKRAHFGTRKLGSIPN